jgi:predicted GNAT superfamily acetyltransferase
MSEIEVRPLTTMAEIRETENVQRLTWNMSDLEILSAHAMHALQYNGACLLGAFDGPTMVGFVLGVLGTVESRERIDQVAAARLKMYSVMAGVLPAYQKRGVGYQLKLGQRDFALRIGVRLITWTYDPLESVNARFNIAKLGAISHHYWRNFHGDMGGINAGLPTDRLNVEWWVTSNRVQSRVARQRRPLALDALLGGGALLVNEATFDSRGLPVPPPNYISHPSNLILVEIPADFQAIKQKDFALAQRWREHTRHLFEELFPSGFMITDFVYHSGQAGEQRSFYLLTHESA